MADFWLVKKDDGKLHGLSPTDEKRYAKTRLVLNGLEVGETVRMGGVKLPRSPRHHGFFFSKLRELFDRQERFADMDRLRDWLTVGAGFADFYPGPGGSMIAFPESIAWDECDEQRFTEISRGVEDFMWTDLAQATLWPHLSPKVRRENVEGWHAQAEENRKNAIIRMHHEGRI